MKTKKTELLSKDATPAEIEAAIDVWSEKQTRYALPLIGGGTVILLLSAIVSIGYVFSEQYWKAFFSLMLGMNGMTAFTACINLKGKPIQRLGKRLFTHPTPLTFRQAVLGYFSASRKQKKQSLTQFLQIVEAVTAEEIATLTSAQKMGVFCAIFMCREPKVALAGLELAQRMELVEALFLLELVVGKSIRIHQTREVRTRAKEVINFLRPLAALQKTEAQLLRPAPASTPPEQLLRVPQETNEPEINLLRPVE